MAHGAGYGLHTRSTSSVVILATVWIDSSDSNGKDVKAEPKGKGQGRTAA